MTDAVRENLDPPERTDAPATRGEFAGVRYIGSKARVVDGIMDVIGGPPGSRARFVDGFAGTGVVASRAADHGWRVLVNDHLLSAVCMTTARLISMEEAQFATLGGYSAAIDDLNASPGIDGFFSAEYSPAGAAGRMYFTEQNARRIDAIRASIRSWVAAGEISELECRLLVADLISACARVANIAGTYGCFLTHWTKNSLQDLFLEPRPLRQRRAAWEATSLNVEALNVQVEDVVYLDPPYTKRQYAAYYHVNETLAHGDDPEVEGKTGLRPWHGFASAYCYKRRALNALVSLLADLPSRQIYLSYSSEGHVTLEALRVGIEEFARVEVHQLGSIGRYRPNAAASAAADDVTEVLLAIEKPVRN